jgi:homoserine kinase type II
MAVYTDVSFEDLEIFLEAYDIGEARVFKGIAEGVSNSNYFLQTDKGRYILTLYEKRTEISELPFFLGLMEHLAASGLPCPTPLHMKNGASSAVLNGRTAAVLTFLDGISLRRPGAEHCIVAGRALAELHAKGGGFAMRRANGLGLRAWGAMVAECANKADDVQPGLKQLMEKELAHLESHWPQTLPTGVIHADFFPDNVLFLETKVSGIIDFYFACYDSLAYDLAVTLNAWCFETDGAYNLTKGQALLQGYQEVRLLNPAERAAFPLLCRGAAMRFLLTRLYDWLNRAPEALVRLKDPREFGRRLRFHQGVRSPEAYGI